MAENFQNPLSVYPISETDWQKLVCCIAGVPINKGLFKKLNINDKTYNARDAAGLIANKKITDSEVKYGLQNFV